MKKLVSLLLALIMVLSMSSIALAADEPVELTLAVIRRATDISNSYNERAWVKDAEKALNVKLTFVELPEGSHAEPLAGLLAGEQIDVYFMGMHFADSIITENPGMFHAYTMDEIKTYAPTYYALAEEHVEDWQTFTTWPDGNIYGLMGHNARQATGLLQGIQYLNYQWLENLDLEVPTTMDEFYNVLVAFRDQDPNMNGVKDEIPIDFCNANYAGDIMYFASSWGLALGDNGEPLYTVTDDDRVVGAMDTQAYREFLEFFHKLAEEGLLNIEGLTQTKEQWDANLSAGKVGVFWTWGPYNNIPTELKLEYNYFVPVPAEGYETKIYPNNPIRANRDGWVITKRAEEAGKVEIAMKLYDYWCTPANSLNVQLGPQGIAWEWVDEANLIYKTIPTPVEAEDPEGFAAYAAKMKEAGYEHLIDKTYNGSNTIGYQNSAPLFVKAAQYDMTDTTHNTVRRILSEQAFSAVFANRAPSVLIPAEVSEELKFMTDGLSNYINGFCAESILNGVTDDSWNAYLTGLETYNYSYLVEYYDKLIQGTLF